MRALGFAAAAVLFVVQAAHAYRPFDTTDAAVAHAGELEFEIGPVGYLRTGSAPFLVAPSAVVRSIEVRVGLTVAVRAWEAR